MSGGVVATLRSIIPSLDGKVHAAMVAAVTQVANQTMNDSKQNYCPVNTGVLRASGKVDIVVTPTGVTARLSYGGAASKYALIVHENPKPVHPHGQWKYLEAPITKKAKTYTQELGRAFQAAMQ